MPEEKKKKEDSVNLRVNFQKITEINDWFEKREDIDVEQGLKKIKQAIELIKASKKRLKSIENEFEEIKKEIE